MLVFYNPLPFLKININSMNRAISSTNEFSDVQRPLRRAWYCLLQNIAPGRFTCLEPSCDGNPMVIESRKAKWVQYYVAALNAGIDPDALADVCECGELDVCNLSVPSSSSSSSSSSSN